MNWSTRLRRWVRIRTPPVREASMKPTAATVLPAPVACSNQKRRSAPGSSGASSTTSSSSSAGCSSQSCGSSSAASSSSSSSSSTSSSHLGPASLERSAVGGSRRRVAVRRCRSGSPSAAPACCSAISSARVPGEGVHLVRVQLGAVAQLRRLVGEQALEAEQQREVAAPLDRGVLGALVDLGQRGVERPPPRGARGERLGPLAVEQEGLAGELRRTLDVGA